MCAWIVPPTTDLIEPTLAPEIHADGVGAIEIANGCVRIYLYAEQLPLAAAAEQPMRVITAKIVGPIARLPATIGKLALCLTPEAGIEPQRRFTPHLVT